MYSNVQIANLVAERKWSRDTLSLASKLGNLEKQNKTKWNKTEQKQQKTEQKERKKQNKQTNMIINMSAYVNRY